MRTLINAVWDALLPADSVAHLDGTRFLSRCRTQSISRHELEVFLVQQHHYAKHFTRYLCALLVNLTREEDRSVLLDNLFEEMGYGDLGEEPHAEIYRKMLVALDLEPNSGTVFPETADLIATMLRLCSDPNPMVGLGALCVGAEAIVPHVYSQIMQGLRAQGFVEHHLRFFALHIEGDDGHALTMKAIIDRELTKDPEAAGALLRSASECIDKRVAFFEAICQHSQRRDAPQEVKYAV